MLLAALVATAGTGLGTVATPATARGGPPHVVDRPLSATERSVVRLPVTGVVQRLFDAPAQRWASGHRGIDLAAVPGTVVTSPADGTVVVAQRVVDRSVVTIRHDDGLRSSLEPVLATVGVGTRLAAGQPLGTVEAPPARSHCPVRCLHWGVRDGETYVDPLALLPGAGPVVLLPVPHEDGAGG